MKKVSVIIPCYNQGYFVAEATESALAQTYQNIEIIIINDASMDDSDAVICRLLEKHPEIRYICNRENRGVVFSRNAAIDCACGEYILPLDADDTIEPTYIEKAVDILDRDPSVGIVYCKATLWEKEKRIWDLPVYSKETMLFENCIFNCALFRKQDFLKAGKYKEYMRDGYEDWDLWLSFIEMGAEVYRIDEVLFNYRRHEGVSRNNQCWNKLMEHLKNLCLHHQTLYLSSDVFCSNAFYPESSKIFKKIQKKYKKYKRLFNIVLFLLITSILVFSVVLAFACSM